VYSPDEPEVCPAAGAAAGACAAVPEGAAGSVDEPVCACDGAAGCDGVVAAIGGAGSDGVVAAVGGAGWDGVVVAVGGAGSDGVVVAVAGAD